MEWSRSEHTDYFEDKKQGRCFECTRTWGKLVVRSKHGKEAWYFFCGPRPWQFKIAYYLHPHIFCECILSRGNNRQWTIADASFGSHTYGGFHYSFAHGGRIPADSHYNHDTYGVIPRELTPDEDIVFWASWFLDRFRLSRCRRLQRKLFFHVLAISQRLPNVLRDFILEYN